MNTSTINISASTETGSLGVMHLKRFWDKCQHKKMGNLDAGSLVEEWNIDTTLLSAIGVGLEQTLKEIYSSSYEFSKFEDWVLSVNNGFLSQEKIHQFNNYILNRSINFKEDTIEKVLDESDLAFWQENGYIIIKNAISQQDCEDSISAICDFIEIERHDPSTWYKIHPARQGIMVQLFQHPALEKNRVSEKIRKVYEQLWSRTDLWVNTDRVGFNPPETESWKFPGPNMHWDVSLARPIPFGLQGILYLADTKDNQGAFTLVPGFHNKIENWLENLPSDTNPRNENIYALGTKPIVANAGDFIIWHQALPHGSSPNTSQLPRFVQYINYAPLKTEDIKQWI